MQNRWLQIYRIVHNLHPIIKTVGAGVRTFHGTECTDEGNDFELIPTVKMETRHPIEIYFGREFPAICYHCGVLAAWSRQIWNIFEKFLRFLEKRPLMIKLSKFCSESLHHDTDRRCYVQNSWKLSDGKSVKSCVIHVTKKNKISSPSQTVATARIAPKVRHGQPPTFGTQRSKFHPNRFTFGGFIAGRVKAVKMRLKSLQVLGEAIASRRVN